MSIPLDRLYHYIESVAKDVYGDVIIYHFYPHGSKKLSDFTRFRNRPYDWFYSMTTPELIMHDQEPLNYDLYTLDNFKEQWNNKTYCDIPAREITGYLDVVCKLHLRSLTETPSNCWDYSLLVHSELNSAELKKYEQNYFVGVYWWAHAAIARDWFRYAELDPALSTKSLQIKKDFLIYNRAWSGTREYRLTLSEMIIDWNLVDCVKMNFNAWDQDQHYTMHDFQNSLLKTTRSDIETFYPKNTYCATSSADYDAEDYNTTAIEIVLETLYDDQRWHLTEKTLRPIACGQPFILAGTPGSLQYLHRYGFRTFAPYINEDYDQIQCPRKRLLAIVQEMKRISDLATEQKQQLWQQLNLIADYNRQLFFSPSWQQNIFAELKNNLETSVNFMRNNRTGLHRTRTHQALKAAQSDQLLQQNRKFRSLDQTERLEQWLKSQ